MPSFDNIGDLKHLNQPVSGDFHVIMSWLKMIQLYISLTDLFFVNIRKDSLVEMISLKIWR